MFGCAAAPTYHRSASHLLISMAHTTCRDGLRGARSGVDTVRWLGAWRFKDACGARFRAPGVPGIVPQRRDWQLGGGGGGSLALPRAAHLAGQRLRRACWAGAQLTAMMALAGGRRWQQRVIDVQRLWYAR